ncbi:E3 ubiquitin-protein ligase TRIM47 isoform X1 [Corythoichthys intestinalis]|uniref:E3 ubiquitin-protein ligase TRIM47 isoform X1 n=1 Tax=Corythoichthys intestinalis TaxID=161448 RepID=UPI0025A5C8CC|nr:E3 ubiquitin-protein ligase TRIM47 isoform X1 [Corythoichthys intestinalis]
MATAAASSGDDLRKELTCAICLDFYTDPVILKCGHNFCRFCICMHWDENGGDYGYQCPQCRTVFNKRTFTKNYLVQNLVAKMDDLECLGSVASPAGPLKMDGECRLHGEELKLYCQTDKEAICVVCRESRVHRHHEVAPVSEVAHDMKVELHLRLMDLNRHRSQCLRVIAADERTKNEVRMKKQRLKDKVEADVGALVQFLLDERDSLLDSLDAEEAAAVAALDDNLDAVKAEAAAAERRLADVRAHVGGETTFQSLAETFNDCDFASGQGGAREAVPRGGAGGQSHRVHRFLGALPAHHVEEDDARATHHAAEPDVGPGHGAPQPADLGLRHQGGGGALAQPPGARPAGPLHAFLRRAGHGAVLRRPALLGGGRARQGRVVPGRDRPGQQAQGLRQPDAGRRLLEPVPAGPPVRQRRRRPRAGGRLLELPARGRLPGLRPRPAQLLRRRHHEAPLRLRHLLPPTRLPLLQPRQERPGQPSAHLPLLLKDQRFLFPAVLTVLSEERCCFNDDPSRFFKNRIVSPI